MRLIIGLFAAISIGTLSQALATDPPSSPAPQDATQSTTAAPTKATSTNTTEPVSTTTSTSTAPTAAASDRAKVKLTAGDREAGAELKRLKAAGYKPEVRGGEVFFCRNEQLLGSRFEKKVCATSQQLQHQSSEAKEITSTAQRNMTSVPTSN